MSSFVLSSVIEETEEPVKIHGSGFVQDGILPRVLEVVHSFIRVLKPLVEEYF